MSYTVIQDVSVKEDKKHYSVFFPEKYLSFFNEKLFFLWVESIPFEIAYMFWHTRIVVVYMNKT